MKATYNCGNNEFFIYTKYVSNKYHLLKGVVVADLRCGFLLN